jgi:hypothetical protein
MWTICAEPVGNDGKRLWIGCRKPAAAAVEIAGISADKALDNAPAGLWIAGGIVSEPGEPKRNGKLARI